MPADTEGVAVVGGGTGALGRAVVDRLLADGWRVAVPARRVEDAGLPAGVAVERCDLGSPEDVSRFAAAVSSLGPWRALVNCSGGYAGGSAHETEDGEALRMLDLNLLGPWRLATAAARAMARSGTAGRIVNVAGRAAVEPAAGQAAYQVAKAALLRLTEVMALELRESGITVNAVLPSVMDTPGNRSSMPRADRSRWVPVEQVAAAVAWLLSDDAAPVSGAAVPVYGRA